MDQSVVVPSQSLRVSPPSAMTRIITDSEEIEFQVEDFVHQCDLIIDHTDTFKGRGFLRALVRLLLEARGARMVGSDAKASFLADDKIAAKAWLSAAGIPTPPGIIVTSREWELPPWLEPPLVLKPAFEHMSRGLVLARNKSDALLKAADLLQQIWTTRPGRSVSPRTGTGRSPPRWPKGSRGLDDPRVEIGGHRKKHAQRNV